MKELDVFFWPSSPCTRTRDGKSEEEKVSGSKQYLTRLYRGRGAPQRLWDMLLEVVGGREGQQRMGSLKRLTILFPPAYRWVFGKHRMPPQRCKKHETLSRHQKHRVHQASQKWRHHDALPGGET